MFIKNKPSSINKLIKKNIKLSQAIYITMSRKICVVDFMIDHFYDDDFAIFYIEIAIYYRMLQEKQKTTTKKQIVEN